MFSRKITLAIFLIIIVVFISYSTMNVYIKSNNYPILSEKKNTSNNKDYNSSQNIGDGNTNPSQVMENQENNISSSQTNNNISRINETLNTDKSIQDSEQSIQVEQYNENNGNNGVVSGVVSGVDNSSKIDLRPQNSSTRVTKKSNRSIPENNVEKLPRENIQDILIKTNKFEEQFNLLRGRAIVSIPDSFKINIPRPIEASIVPKIIDKEKLFEQLKIQGEPKIIKDEILYSPSGVDIKLKIDKDRFKIREVNTGIKPIISEIPELWIWEVTPLQKGNTNITLLVEIKLKNKQNDKELVKYFPIFNELRPVDSNLSYSISQFIGNFWKELTALLFGSGSFAGFVKWYIERRDAKKAKEEPEPEPKPEPTRLIDRLKRKFLRRE